MAGTKENSGPKKTTRKTRCNVGASGSVKVSIDLSRASFAELNETWTKVKSLGHWKNKQEFRSALIKSGIASLNLKLSNF